MMIEFKNPDYDFEQLLETIGKESPTLQGYVESALEQVDSNYHTEKIWLGTMQTGQHDTPTQVYIVVSRDTNSFIDED
ncbi:MAG: hypothetical protein HRU25_15430 [Psychrobium sp.]|nr:hypothetical protein [Psychrobium sp.]